MLPDMWLYCLFKVSPCALVLFCIHFTPWGGGGGGGEGGHALSCCHAESGFLVKFQFLPESHSVFVKIS